MARGMALMAAAVVMLVVVLAGGTSATAFQKFYGSYGPATSFFPPTYYHTPPLHPPFMYSGAPFQAIRIAATDPLLPCPNVGFYTHPTNCSRFYRCVDHTGTGFFVRYVFECPRHHVFVQQKPGSEDSGVCLPGVCAGKTPPIYTTEHPLTPSHKPPPFLTQKPKPTTPFPIPSTDPPIPSTNPPIPSTDPPTAPPTVTPSAPTGPPVEPQTHPTPIIPSTDPPTPPPPIVEQQTPPPGIVPPQVEPPRPPNVFPPVIEPQTLPSVVPVPPDPNESCEGHYDQDKQYCNVYRRCNDTATRYLCPPGTVFDSPRQMCRIMAADEALCDGKVIAKFPPSLRFEMVDGHIRIPDDIVLSPIVPFMPLDLPPHHSLRNHPIHGLPAPYHGLPADTLPLHVPYQPQSFSLVRPRPLTSPFRAGGFDSAPPSVNNVRRPQGHLHFPPYSPYAYGTPDVGPHHYYNI